MSTSDSAALGRRCGHPALEGNVFLAPLAAESFAARPASAGPSSSAAGSSSLAARDGVSILQDTSSSPSRPPLGSSPGDAIVPGPGSSRASFAQASILPASTILGVWDEVFPPTYVEHFAAARAARRMALAHGAQDAFAPTDPTSASTITTGFSVVASPSPAPGSSLRPNAPAFHPQQGAAAAPSTGLRPDAPAFHPEVEASSPAAGGTHPFPSCSFSFPSPGWTALQASLAAAHSRLRAARTWLREARSAERDAFRDLVELREERAAAHGNLAVEVALEGLVGDASTAYARATADGAEARDELAAAREGLAFVQSAEDEIRAAQEQGWWIADEVAWRYGLLRLEEAGGAGWYAGGEQLAPN